MLVSTRTTRTVAIVQPLAVKHIRATPSMHVIGPSSERPAALLSGERVFLKRNGNSDVAR